MGSEWTSLTIENAMEAIIDYRGKTPRKTNAGVPLITAKVIKNGRILPTQEYIAEEDYDSWMRRGHPRVGDVVLTTEAPLGEVAQLSDSRIALAQRLITLRAKAKLLDATFLKALLQASAFQHQLQSRASGTTVLGIKQSELRKIEITFPPLKEQKAIAHILGSLDDKIELNRQMNTTLENMAQALFKSWFVDFDPVIDNALVAGNEIPPSMAKRAETRKQALKDGTANRQIAKDFPDSFYFTDELGWVPVGWEATTVEELVQINATSWSAQNHPAAVRYVDLASVKSGEIKKVTSYQYSHAPSRARRVLQVGDTIFALVRPSNRSFAFIQDEGLTGSTGFAVLHPRSKIHRTFLYRFLTQEATIDHLARIADGAAYPAVKPIDFASLCISLPSNEPVSRFEKISDEQMAKHFQNSKQSQSLTKLRDTLLPKLISGELRIPDAEKRVEAALT